MKTRLDKLLVERGLVASRERAQAMIMSGRVLVAEQKVEKPGAAVESDSAVRMLGEDLRFVSRGGLKLDHALETWAIGVEGKACVDIGASTGGFTDCLLQRGAARVLAVDTGYGQMAHRIRTDERVKLLERTNARLLAPGALAAEFPAAMAASFFAMDVSFIGASLVLPPVVAALALPGKRWEGEAVVLVKPQFEAGREHVGKGGIVRDAKAQELAVERVRSCVLSLGGDVLAVMDSPILGMEGNREFLLHAKFRD